MKVACLILAGGRGTRLRPITYFLHKTLLPLKRENRVIDYALKSCNPLSMQIKTEIFVLAGYKADQLQRYLCGRFNISVLVESELRGTGSAILQSWSNIKRSTPDIVLIMPGDHYIFLPLEEACLPFECEKTKLVLVCARRNESHHDYINFCGNEVIEISKNTQSKTNLAFTGISLIKFSVLDEYVRLLNFRNKADLTKDIIIPLIRNYGGQYFILDSPWDDIGTWSRYLKTYFKIKNKGDR